VYSSIHPVYAISNNVYYITQATGCPIVVVGHSLGGMLARFLGVNFPKQICHVVAIGSPIDNSMQVHPLVLLAFHLLQVLRRTVGDLSPECTSSRPCTCKFAQAVSSPLPQGVGFTAIFSKEDGVVDWRACLDPHANCVEVDGSHCGMAVNPAVYEELEPLLLKTEEAACRQ